MLQSQRIQKALDAIEEACGHCPVCSPDCPIAVARRAMSGLLYDVKEMEAYDGPPAECE